VIVVRVWYYFKGCSSWVHCKALIWKLEICLLHSKWMDSLEVIFIMGQQLVTWELLFRVGIFQYVLCTCYHAQLPNSF